MPPSTALDRASTPVIAAFRKTGPAKDDRPLNARPTTLVCFVTWPIPFLTSLTSAMSFSWRMRSTDIR